VSSRRDGEGSAIAVARSTYGQPSALLRGTAARRWTIYENQLADRGGCWFPPAHDCAPNAGLATTRSFRSRIKRVLTSDPRYHAQLDIPVTAT